jgi:hypothetical protein
MGKLRKAQWPGDAIDYDLPWKEQFKDCKFCLKPFQYVHRLQLYCSEYCKERNHYVRLRNKTNGNTRSGGWPET